MAEGGLAGTAFVDLVPRFGTGFGAGLASKLKSLAAPAAVVGIGAGLFTIGEKFESTFNKIRVQTGATGGVFEKLRDDAKNVLAGTAGSFDQVSAAIGGLYQRTHLTGPALDELAKKEVTLGRITKTDVGANVEATTSLFARYGISARGQSKALDELFKASQAGGKGIGTLTGELQKGAPALQAYGFGFEKSAALVASLERAGVNVTPVLTGLRTAFGKIAKEGKDPQKVLAGIFKELRDGKDPTKATGDAIKLFGARGGAELSAAIRAGRFDVDALLKTITNGKGGILETGDAVSTIGSKFARLKNIALVALEPIATKLVDLANVGLKKVVDGVTAAGPIITAGLRTITAGFDGEKLRPGANLITRILNGIGVTARTVKDHVVADAGALFTALTGGDTSKLTGVAATFAGIGTAIRTALGQAVTFIRGIDFGKLFEGARTAFAGVVDAIRGVDFGAIFGHLKDIVAPILPPLLELGRAVIKLAIAAFPVLVSAVKDLRPLFVGIVATGYVLARIAGVVIAVALKVTAKATELLAHHAGILRPILISLVAGFVALKVVRGVQAGILGAARAAGHAYGTFQRLGGQAAGVFRNLKGGISTVASLAKSFLTGAVNIARQTAAFVAQKVAAIATAVATKAMAAAQWLLNAAMDANPVVLIVAGIAALAAGVVLAYQHFKPFRDIVDLVGRALGTLAHVITGALSTALGWVRSHWPLLLAILTGPFGLAVLAITRNFDRIKGILTNIVGFVAGLPARIGAAVSHLWDGLKTGITSARNWIGDRVTDVVGFFKALPGRIGTAVVGIWHGITSSFAHVKQWLSDRVDDVVGFFTGLPDRISSAASGMFDFIKNSFKDALNWIIDKWNNFHIGGGSFLGIHIPRFDTPNIPRLAAGGVITEPTVALLGETGKARPEIAAPAAMLRSIFRSELDRRTPPKLPALELKIVTAPVVTAPVVNPARFAEPFRPPAPAITDRPVEHAHTAARALEDHAPERVQPIHQENHFHGHDKPTAPELDYAGRQLAWRLANTGRRP